MTTFGTHLQFIHMLVLNKKKCSRSEVWGRFPKENSGCNWERKRRRMGKRKVKSISKDTYYNGQIQAVSKLTGS